MIMDKIRSARQLRKNQLKTGMLTLKEILEKPYTTELDYGKSESYIMLHPIGNQLDVDRTVYVKRLDLTFKDKKCQVITFIDNTAQQRSRH